MTVLTVVLGFLLVFRTNQAYDRFYEARKVWSTLTTSIRNMSRIFVIHIGKEKKLLQILGCIPIAIKDHLRGDSSFELDTLGLNDTTPQALILYLHLQIRTMFTSNTIDSHTQNAMITLLNGMVDQLGTFERIKTTPVPTSYIMHLKLTIFIYLICLPFQMVQEMGWVTCLVSMLASLTLLGIEAIGEEIENPFGWDRNDLDMDLFCDIIQYEVKALYSLDLDSFGSNPASVSL
jgi:putative membrane protein